MLLETEIDIERRKRIERHMQNKIDYLKSTTDGYKSAIDKCGVAELSSYSWMIAIQTKDLKDVLSNLNKGQEEQFDNLQREYIQQFDRLRHDHCECKPKVIEQGVTEYES
jgi:hypothetical protein